jgi:hypothetical protein
MNDQGLGDWLAQIEKTSMLNEAEHLLFAVLEAVSSAEFILSCLEDLRMTFKCELDYIQSWDTMCSSLFGSKLVKTDNSRKRHMW